MNVSNYRRMNPEQLREWLQIRNRTSCIPNNKGKGSYNREKEKFDFQKNF